MAVLHQAKHILFHSPVSEEKTADLQNQMQLEM